MIDLYKNNQRKPSKLSVEQKKKVLPQTKSLQEKIGSFCLETVTMKEGISPSSKETVFRVLQKAGLAKWTRVQRKGTLVQNSLKLRLKKFAPKVRCKLSANF